MATSIPFDLAIAGIIGGWEIVLILAITIILAGAKKLPDIAKDLGTGLLRFRDSTDELSHNVGRSLGGIYGKPASEALTPQNEVAELYDPAALREVESNRPGRRIFWFRRLIALCRKAWQLILRLLNVKK